jgi:integrase
MASIAKRGNSYRVKIFDKATLVATKSFRNRADAKAWGEGEDEKVAFRRKHGDFVLHPSGLATVRKGTSINRATPEEIKLYLDRDSRAPENAKQARRDTFRATVPPLTAVVTPPTGPTFGDLIKRYKAEVTPHKRSFATENNLLDALKRLKLAAKQVTALTTDDFEEWAKTRLKTVCGDTVNRQLGLIHHIFEVGRTTWKITMPTDPNGNTINPAKIKRQPSSEPRDIRLTPDEQACLLRHAAEDSWGDKLVLPLELCFEINFRRGELFLMKRSDIHWAAKKLFLAGAITKNGKPRDVPLTSRTIAILRRVVKAIPSDHRGRVFPIAGTQFAMRFQRVLARAAKEMPNIANFRFHDTRHQAISEMAKKIPNAILLAKATGHRDVNMLMRYTNPKASELADMLE